MPRMVSDQVKEDIRFRNDIVDVVGSYLNLKRAGSSFKALCPWHKEKTPSFTVNEQRQTYHCFGCGSGGDVFNFIQQYEGVDFPSAIEMLAQRAGVTLSYENKDQQQPRVQKNPILEVLEKANKFYHEMLFQNQGQSAREYLQSRKVNKQSIEKFQLGFAPDSWDSVLSYLSKQGFSEETIEQAGMIIKRGENREGYYDRFRNRLMFPIQDVMGGVVGFSARALEQGPPTAKYINSPETAVYHKSKILYGLNLAQKAIYDQDKVEIIEGATDVIACHQNGLETTVAPCGTALTKDHANLLLRKFPSAEFRLVFDGDDAGRNAAAKTSATLLGRGNAKVYLLSEGLDPASIYEQGEKLEDHLVNGKSGLEFLVDHNASGQDLEDEGEVISLLTKLTPAIRDAPESSHSLLFEFLSKRLNLSADSIAEKIYDSEARGSSTGSSNARRKWEKRFMRQLMADGKLETIRYFCNQDADSMLSNSENRELLRYLDREAMQAEQNPLLTGNNALSYVNDPLYAQQARKKIIDGVLAKARETKTVLRENLLWGVFQSTNRLQQRKDQQRERLMTGEIQLRDTQYEAVQEIKQNGDMSKETEKRLKEKQQKAQKQKRNISRNVRHEEKPRLEELENTFLMIKTYALTDMVRQEVYSGNIRRSELDSMVDDILEQLKEGRGF